MISKLPRWAWFGAGVLAAIAGMINAVGFLSFQHQGITHLTGTTTLLGLALADGDGGAIAHYAVVILAFLAGCMASGAIVQQSSLQLGRRYGIALMVESVLLFAAVPLLDHLQPAGLYLAAGACGLQNGMASTYSGAVFRTSHVSGIFTDLGIALGQQLTGLAVDVRRIRLGLMIVGCFLGGALLGRLGFLRLEYAVLYVPAVTTGVVGFSYTLYRRRSLQ